MNNGKVMNKQKIDFRLEAKSIPNEDKAVVYLYGDIVDERPTNVWSGEIEEGEFIIPSEVRSLFEGIEENNIDLHINSYGGSVFASISIFNYLKGLDKNLNTFNDGICASGASLIFMAGKKAHMEKNTILMIHRASTFGWGNHNDFKKIAEVLETIDTSTQMETYKIRFKGTNEELIELIDKESWMSAEEAFKYGFCDEIIESKMKEQQTDNTSTNNTPTQAEITNGINLMKNFARLKV